MSRVRAHAGSDVGRIREGNEDNFFAGTTVFAVADGMGGHQAGEVASALALEPIAELDGRPYEDPAVGGNALVDAIEEANRVVVERARSDDGLRGMGTTLTAVMVVGDQLLAAHVGDSRAYLLRPDDGISQLTTDHTLVERLVREGRLSRDEIAVHPQRNVITRAIGNDPDVLVDSLPPLILRPGDRVLLCSDGLTGPVDDADIASLVEVTGGGQDAVDALIGAANEAGGPDNITVVLLEVGGPAGPADDEGATASVPVAPAGTGSDPGAAAGTATATIADPATDPEVDRAPTNGSAGAGTGTADDRGWAETIGRYGDRGDGPAPRDRPSRVGRVVGALLGVVVLLGLLVGGGWFLLSRAYFVGDDGGFVAVFRGLPEEVAGVPLYWVVEDEVSEVAVADLPPFRRADIEEGLSAGTLREATQVVANLRRLVEEEAASPTTGTDGTAASEAPGAAPVPTAAATTGAGT